MGGRGYYSSGVDAINTSRLLNEESRVLTPKKIKTECYKPFLGF